MISLIKRISSELNINQLCNKYAVVIPKSSYFKYQLPMQKRQQIQGEEKKQSDSNWKWDKKGTIIYGSSSDQASNLVIGLDMDDTMIKTKSGARFAKDANDWVLWHESVSLILKDRFDEGYRIVIFTNQNGIAKGHTDENNIKKKIQDIASAIGIKMTALMASHEDENRKPTLGMWKHFTEIMNEGKQIDMEKSFYIGDAAGRKDGKKKDFSDTDLKFALNIGIQFQTPEQFFLKKDLNQDYGKLISFNPKLLPKAGPLFKGDTAESYSKPSKPEMVIMVGSVGSGKSTFVFNHLKEYVRINRDTLKTKEKCLQKAEEAMKENKYVVIDNTNPKADDRKPYIDLAKKYAYPVRAFYLQVTKDLAMHNDQQRETNKFREHFSKRVGSIQIHAFFKNSEIPNKNEGLADVNIVNFYPGPYKNQQDEDSFTSFSK